MGQPFEIDGRVFDVAPRYRPEGGFDLEVDGEPLAARLVELLAEEGAGRFELRIDGRVRTIWIAVHGDRTFLHAEGQSFEVTRVDSLARLHQASLAARDGAGLTAPMPGVLVEVRAPVGTMVEAGDTIVVIESMKLQTAIVTETAGRVSEIGFEVGQSFDRDAVLARVESGDAGTDADAPGSEQ